MKKIKCCYCLSTIDIAKGAIQHAKTKRVLCVKCLAETLAGFIVGIAPYQHTHSNKDEVKR